MAHKRTLFAAVLLLLFSCYYSGISMFSHVHIVHGSSVVHSHLGGNAEHDHSDSEYAVIDILSHFQSEAAFDHYDISTPFFLLTESLTEYQGASYLNEVYSELTLRGPPQA